MKDPIRASFRRYVRLPCQVVREHDFKLVGDLALDLSSQGMLVRASQRMLTGDEVIVAFKLPRSTQWFDAQGIVSRVLHGRRPNDYAGLAFGIQFLNLSSDDQYRLFDSLRGLAAPDAARPPRSLAA